MDGIINHPYVYILGYIQLLHTEDHQVRVAMEKKVMTNLLCFSLVLKVPQGFTVSWLQLDITSLLILYTYQITFCLFII